MARSNFQSRNGAAGNETPVSGAHGAACLAGQRWEGYRLEEVAVVTKTVSTLAGSGPVSVTSVSARTVIESSRFTFVVARKSKTGSLVGTLIVC